MVKEVLRVGESRGNIEKSKYFQNGAKEPYFRVFFSEKCKKCGLDGLGQPSSFTDVFFRTCVFLIKKK